MQARKQAKTGCFEYFRVFTGCLCLSLSLSVWTQESAEPVQTSQNPGADDPSAIESAETVQISPDPGAGDHSATESAEPVQTSPDPGADGLSAIESAEPVQTSPDPGADDPSAIESADPVQTSPDPGADGLSEMESAEPVQTSPDPGARDLSTIESAEPVQPPPNPATDYLSAIEGAEAANGAYSTELSELYFGFGKSLAEQEKFDEAKTAFQRGLQVERINFGLNSPKQEQYLFAIADLEVRNDDWNATESVLDNIYWINANTYGERTPGMVAGLTELIRWYVATYTQRSPVNAYLNLLRAEELAQQMEGIIEHQFGLNHPNTTNVLRQVSRLHFFMLNLLAQYGELINLELMSDSTSMPDSIRHNRLPVTEDLLIKGASNYSKIIDSIDKQDGTTLLERVEAITRLGDWNLILGQRQTAGKMYQRAYELIANSENPEPTLAEFFDTPRLIRFSELENSVTSDAPVDDESKTVQVSMTIQSSGRPYAIKVLDPPGEMSKDLISQTEKNVRRLPFRPRLDNGIPVQTEGFIFNYPIENSDVKS